MKKVLVLGAGLVSRPLVRYLLDHDEIELTVATRTVSKAEALIQGHPRGRTVQLLANDHQALSPLVQAHDLAVSLLPAPLHPVVAELCIKHGKQMVTTSYVSPEMRALHERALDAGVTILNEIGVDPGIDHMSAMRIIDDVRTRGGQVVSFKSYCGGLPAPEANDNPFGYKFSWSPRAVCTAGRNDARYRKSGQEVFVPGPELFAHRHGLSIDGAGDLVAYPNRDSLGYSDLYGLEGIDTMFRGTLRYPGWCETLKVIADLGMLDESGRTCPSGVTYAGFLTDLLGLPAGANARTAIADRIEGDEAEPILDRLAWLGLFDDDPIPGAAGETAPLDVLCGRMAERMPYQAGERDMIILFHHFIAQFPSGAEEEITSTLLDFGQPDGDSAMARTVSLPAAIATRLIVTGKVSLPGVHIPTQKSIYDPVLEELSRLDIRCVEKTAQRT